MKVQITIVQLAVVQINSSSMVHFEIYVSKILNWIIFDSFLIILTKIVPIYKPGLLYIAIMNEYFWAAISS